MVVLLQELHPEDLVVERQKMDRATKNVLYPQYYRLKGKSHLL